MQELSVCQPNHLLSDKVFAFSTTRDSSIGYSKNEGNKDFSAFNLGLHVEDDKRSVMANRKTLNNFIDSKLDSNSSLVWLEQIHSNTVLQLNSVEDLALYTQSNLLAKADAIITNQANAALCIMTADCVPILLCDVNGEQIAAIHAGWKGLQAGIIEKTIACFRAPVSELRAWIGPSISQQNFETGAELAEVFSSYRQAIQVSSINKKYLVDLKLISAIKLREYGLSAIQISPQCTYADPELFYSHRRSTHLRHQSCGRMANVIVKQ